MGKVYGKFCISPIRRMANTPWLLAVGVVLTLTVAALAFGILEGGSLLDGFYWASTTMTSVGYGDLSPVTWGGKVMTIVFQLWSLFILLPCAVANIISAVLVDKDKLTHAEQEYMLRGITALAGKQGIDLGPEPHDYLGEN